MAGHFEWDPEKNRTNRAKHGISLEEAKAIFEGPVITAPDDRFEYEEQRFISYGQLGNSVIVVAHVTRGEHIRLISARKANRREREAYFEHREETTEGD